MRRPLFLPARGDDIGPAFALLVTVTMVTPLKGFEESQTFFYKPLKWCNHRNRNRTTPPSPLGADV